MIRVIYERSWCFDRREFKNRLEFEEWFERQIVLYPDTKITQFRTN